MLETDAGVFYSCRIEKKLFFQGMENGRS
jgi:hypothetical protein